MKRLCLACFLIFACGTMPCCTNNSENSNKSTAGIVAQAGSVAVTTEDLTQALKGMPGPQQFEYLSDQGRKLLIDMLIDWKLLSQEALKAGLDRDASVKSVLKNTKSAYERDQVLGSAYLRRRIEQLQPVSDEQIQDYYDSHSAEFALDERRKVNRIRFASQERAREALPQLSSGMAFEQYKEQYTSEKIDVDTVWLQATNSPNEFEAAVLKLNVGEMSDVISTQSGSCVARILEISPAKKLTLAEVRERLQAQLQDSNERELIAEIRQTLRKDLAIDMNTGLLDSYECSECAGRAAAEPGGVVQTEKQDMAR